MAKVEVGGRRYATAEDISPEQAMRAKVLVEQMETIIREDFSKSAQESRVSEFREMCKELEDMGFLVNIKYDVNLETGEIAGHVAIFVARPVNKKDQN